MVGRRFRGEAETEAADARWRGRVEELLYDGESVTESVVLDPSRVVVTSHRVLAFMPERDGPNFRQVDRPNVVGVSRGADGEGAYLVRGIRWMAIGAILLVTGALVDLNGLLGGVDLGEASAASQIGAGGVLGIVRTTLDVLAALDEALFLIGVLVTLLGLAAVGFYLQTRESTIVVGVAGDDDLHIPRPEDGVVSDRLEAAITPGRPDVSTDRDGDPLREA